MNSGSKRKRPENTNSKDNKKKNRNCYNCGKKGHYKAECKLNKKQKKNVAPSANLVDECAEIVAMMTLGTVTELHMTTPTPSKDWWYDSGAAIHVCNDKNQFKSYELLEGHEVVMANGVRAKVHGKGDVHLQFTSGKKLVLTNVLHVPDVVKNLMSADILNKKGLKAVLESNNVILSKNGVFVGKGYSCNGMFKLSINKVNDISVYSLASTSSTCSYFLWHGRLGHVNHKVLKFMSKDGLISYNDLENKKCETCVQAKITRLPFPKVERQTQMLDLVHSDVCEFNDFLTRGGNRYFVTFIDDCSRFVYVYLMKHKEEVFGMFKTYKALVENQLNKKIKILRSDRGGEYFPSEFSKFCEESGIVHQTSAPYTPQQNGLAKRKNRTLEDMVNSMLVSSGLPNNL